MWPAFVVYAEVHQPFRQWRTTTVLISSFLQPSSSLQKLLQKWLTRHGKVAASRADARCLAGVGGVMGRLSQVGPTASLYRSLTVDVPCYYRGMSSVGISAVNAGTSTQLAQQHRHAYKTMGLLRCDWLLVCPTTVVGCSDFPTHGPNPGISRLTCCTRHCGCHSMCCKASLAVGTL
jgi:hypothetical protein